MADQQQVSSLSEMINKNKNFQETGGPSPAPSQADVLFDTVKSQMVKQLGILSSSDAPLETQIQDAMKSVKSGVEAGTKSIESSYAQKEQRQEVINTQALTAVQESQRGFATNSALLKQVMDSGRQAINDLEAQKESLIMSGQAAAASKLADLQVTQAQLMLQNRQQIFSNLVALAGVGAQQQQIEISKSQLALQQKSAETELQGKLGSIALQYGVKVGAGDTITDVVNRASTNSKALFDLNLQDAAASLRLKNAQISLANAQAAAASGKTTDNFDEFFSAVNLMGGVSSPRAQGVMQGVAASMASSPASLTAFYTALGEQYKPKTVKPIERVQIAISARSRGLDYPAFESEVTSNPSIENKEEVLSAGRRVFGEPEPGPGLINLFISNLQHNAGSMFPAASAVRQAKFTNTGQ